MAEFTGEEMIDVVFRLPGGRLPVDHAYALCREISNALPWFQDEAAARLHLVHTAASGSGWMRPETSSGSELHLSRRTKLTLRVPERRARDTMALSGRNMQIGGYSLTPGGAKLVPLVPAGTLLARHVVCDDGEDESRLLSRLEKMLLEWGLKSGALICGRAHRIVTPGSVIHTRSLVVTGLGREDALFLLRNGMGPAGKLGCGVFIPYKHIDQ